MALFRSRRRARLTLEAGALLQPETSTSGSARCPALEFPARKNSRTGVKYGRSGIRESARSMGGGVLTRGLRGSASGRAAVGLWFIGMLCLGGMWGSWNGRGFPGTLHAICMSIAPTLRRHSLIFLAPTQNILEIYYCPSGAPSGGVILGHLQANWVFVSLSALGLNTEGMLLARRNRRGITRLLNRRKLCHGSDSVLRFMLLLQLPSLSLFRLPQCRLSNSLQ